MLYSDKQMSLKTAHIPTAVGSITWRTKVQEKDTAFAWLIIAWRKRDSFSSEIAVSEGYVNCLICFDKNLIK